MKSAYELAMERFATPEETPAKVLSWAQKDALAEVDRKYQAKVAERELFLHKQIREARAEGDRNALDQLETQLRNERARLEEEREQAREKVRREDVKLKILIIGSGGREHAMLKACLASPLTAEVVVAPGNGGMKAEARCMALNVEDVPATVALAKEEKVDFVIVGPEVPLALGVVDALRQAGFLAYGPTLDGARLEASKTFCKDFLARHKIPTAQYATFNTLEPALHYLNECQYPLVVKASGLAAGKGVLICENRAAAESGLREIMQERVFGDSGDEVVIEEFLRGEEASIMVVVSGKKYICLPPSQDHKRIGEGDTGLNTGGMGAYAPAAVVDADMQQQIEQNIIEPTLAGLAAEGIDFRGTLFIGLMIEKREAKVLEFNVRFGDPECQVLLPLLESDPLELLIDAARGTLDPAKVKLRSGFAVIVILAAGGYPGSYDKGDVIQLPTELPEGVQIIHAGTKLEAEGKLVTQGGRVLGVVARADNLQAAVDAAYRTCAEVKWEGCYYRKDIAWRQLSREAKA
jgi:phosphoribosylamine---glycine ligase